MEFEIDFLSVGDGERGGDAITLRYGDFNNPEKQFVVVIDGGTKDSGEKLVEHIKNHYNTNYVDLVVATHLHQDHTSGLTKILENLTVEKLAMHLPWSYTKDIKKMTKTESSINRLKKKLEKSINTVSELEDLAKKKNIPIVEPFSGEYLLDNNFLVLGPSKKYYTELLANFGKTPDVKKEHSIAEEIVKFTKESIEWVGESFHIETLKDDDPDTNSENNSSLILLFEIDGKRILFTGDAGKDALSNAILYSDSISKNLYKIDFLDVPHHGSRKNLGPSILDYLLPKTAIVSCPKEGDPRHPSRKIINALVRRKCILVTTKDGPKYHFNGKIREGWNTVNSETLFEKVEK